MGMLREMGQGSCTVQAPRDHLTQPGEKRINFLFTVQVNRPRGGKGLFLRLPSTFRECAKHKPQSHAPMISTHPLPILSQEQKADA